nr:hypothetical protein [uncultured Caproiciproducens sp.]
MINQMVNAFLSGVKADGWGTALYTNNDYRENIFCAVTIETWPIWLADYAGAPDISCFMQQTGSTGKVSGISGNVDMNTCFKDFSAQSNTPTPAPVVPKPTTIPTAVTAIYRVRTVKHGWLSPVTDLKDYAGYQDSPITDVSVRVTAGSVKYRVHVKGGGWLSYVTGYDINDTNNGFAGNGSAIDAIEVYYNTPSGIRPLRRAKYRVAPVNGDYFSWQYDDETSQGMDGYAGNFGHSIGKLQIAIE